MLRKTILAFFGVGFSPLAPGTATSAATAIILYALKTAPPHIPQVFLLLFSSVLLFALYRPADGKDPKWVTLDEVAGQSIALIPFLQSVRPSIPFFFTGFVLFRLLDVLKPPPIKQSQRISGAAGILIDDIIAGGVACVASNLLVGLL